MMKAFKISFIIIAICAIGLCEEIQITPYHPNGDLIKDGQLRRKCIKGIEIFKGILNGVNGIEISWSHNGHGVAEFKIIGKISSENDEKIINALKEWAFTNKVMAYRIDMYARKHEKNVGKNNSEIILEDNYMSYFRRDDL